MASSQPTRSSRFLQDDAFGHWLSGFVAGEGSFFLTMHVFRDRSRNPQHICRFTIGLRMDDGKILHEIRDYFGCGVVKNKNAIPDWRLLKNEPQTLFEVVRFEDLHDRIIPHFERYPLRAKKAEDFAIWKSGVELCRSIQLRTYDSRGKHKGSHPKWTADEDQQFQGYVAAIHETRRFKLTDSEVLAAIESSRRPVGRPKKIRASRQ